MLEDDEDSTDDGSIEEDLPVGPKTPTLERLYLQKGTQLLMNAEAVLGGQRWNIDCIDRNGAIYCQFQRG
ncbi:hypothetical protein FP744_10002627 [Trichoderma asperellum]